MKRIANVRRSRLDIQLGRVLAIGQHWRRREDDTIWRVRQVHRQDCHARLERNGRLISVKFEELRTGWVWIVDQDVAA